MKAPEDREEQEAVVRMRERAVQAASTYAGSLPMFMYYDGPEYELNCPRCGMRHCFQGPGAREAAQGNISCAHCHHKFRGQDQVIVRGGGK